MLTFIKKTTLAFGLVFSFLTGQGQLVIDDDGTILLGKYKTGDSVSKFENDIRLISAVGSKIKMYQYLPSLKEPVEVGNKVFRVLLLYFDTSGRLFNLHFSKSYQPNNFEKESGRDYKSLILFFNDALKHKGTRKVYYRKIHEGHEWMVQNTLVVVDLQKTGKRESTSVGISFRLKQ